MFAKTYEVTTEIAAAPEKVWALLTDAAGFPRWNSTVDSIDGEIALGQRLAVKVPLAPGRTFKPKVVAFAPNEGMTWRDGFAPMFKGVRTFALRRVNGKTEFTMRETLSGVMYPLIAKSLPDFGPAFAAYAADLKRAAEA